MFYSSFSVELPKFVSHPLFLDCLQGRRSQRTEGTIAPNLQISVRLKANYTVILPDWTLKKWGLSNFLGNYRNPREKDFFLKFLWGILDGRTYRPIQKIIKLALFNPWMKFDILWAKCLHLKCYESTSLWFYPKFVSDSVHVLIQVDKSR